MHGISAFAVPIPDISIARFKPVDLGVRVNLKQPREKPLPKKILNKSFIFARSLE